MTLSFKKTEYDSITSFLESSTSAGILDSISLVVQEGLNLYSFSPAVSYTHKIF